jgi:non-ribosomal peptide synthetase component E (peptide arylation enzyme)
MTDAYKPITLEGLAKLNEHDEVGKVLDWLTRTGDLRDYDDEIANRIEDAKTIVRGVVALAALDRLEPALIRAAALEEAARVAEEDKAHSWQWEEVTAAIRALKEQP